MKTEFQKCMDGEIFDGKDKELAEMTLKTKRLLVKLNSTDYADTKQKEAILREMFGHLGENVHVDIDFRCEYGKNIFVGNKVIIQRTNIHSHTLDKCKRKNHAKLGRK